eukprot:jgi/Hompol1/4870/HPOL_001852-RA
MFKGFKKGEKDPATASTTAVANAATAAAAAAPPKREPQSAAPTAQANTNAAASAGDGGSAPLPTTLPGPGLLLIKILESRNLVMPNGSAVVPGGASGKDESLLPFAVVEMDKMEVLVKSLDGNPNNCVANWQSRANLPCEALVSIYMPGPNKSDSVQLGIVKIRPTFVDQKLEDAWLPVVSMSGGEKPNSLGELHIQFAFRLAIAGSIAAGSLMNPGVNMMGPGHQTRQPGGMRR